ncbi:hypothetical protein T492DRAFT_1152157 [Pavlovales sp. CCMP2436]|nr:hypothetical protein T492DRAFT_1152157 [Pavlovales sp. CCMP2436]
MNMIWDVQMLYVAVSRVRTLEQLAVVMSAKQTRYMGEGAEHRTEKARQFGLARAAGQGAIEEYPVGDGRYIADLAVFDIVENGKMKLVKLIEVVVTSPPSKEKLEYYRELGLECEVVYIEKEPPRPTAKIQETLTNVYTTKIARSYEVDDRGFYKLQAPTVPKILTFPEARFWLMCGVTFEAHIAMVSFDSVPISWDETSHTKEGGIRHYAKAVGVGMSTSLSSRFHMCGTEVQAQQYYALALEDPNLDETRVHIRTVGENTIEIEHLVAR